jgi:acyl-coenzyme A thioesterase PaaI-like protein
LRRLELGVVATYLHWQSQGKEHVMPPVRKMSRRQIERGLRLYPPFLGAGIKVQRIADDFLTIEVKMGLRFWNKTGVGTHFGGSLYAMCDPFFMLMLMKKLGPDYLVWDKAAAIRFKRPGTGTVWATFQISHKRVEEIRADTDLCGRSEPQFQALVKDGDDNVIAEVDKFLVVKKREKACASPQLRGPH